ncbi:MAG TPA: ferritin-like protein [Verrucomicrobiae bacterium]|nr:ferritin-like protein [Verrucomicrobiae bacterium]
MALTLRHINARTIRQLMQVGPEKRDIAWLQESLQNAVELELSTLPPYLCGMWSIKSGSDPSNVSSLVNSVVLEEMFHMGLACNMLTALGVAPGILSGYQKITYPGPLPGDVRPQLTVTLAGLTKPYIRDVYMQIEYPESGPIALHLGMSYPTIGAFYDAVEAAFLKLKPTLSATNQLTQNISGNQINPITTLDEVTQAITTIKQQGEGTSQTPDDASGELAHYYKYAEIYHGKQFVQDPVTKKWDYNGPAITFPDVYPMTAIPKGGYVNPAPSVAQALQTFNTQFTTLLTDLQTAWATGSQTTLNQAINDMFPLGKMANAILQFDLPDKSGVYGPDFVVS